MLDKRIDFNQYGVPNAISSKPGEIRKENQDQVELIIVSVGHQIFGLLMSQVTTIVRPGLSGLQIISLPEEESCRLYGEILYHNNSIRVIELSRQLLLPLVEPIEHCKILLTNYHSSVTGKLIQFGVAVDDIVLLRRFSLNDFRVLPNWLSARHLGKLVWGTVLVELENVITDAFKSALPTPFNIRDDSETPLLDNFWPVSATLPGAIDRNKLNLVERIFQRDRQVEHLIVDKRRPLILLDLQSLGKAAFPEIAD